MAAPAQGITLGALLLWFVGLWVAGVATVSAVGYVIRLWLGPA